MKIIKGFENEYIIVSDFGEWVGGKYIDYKSEYKNNQKIIKSLFEKNKHLDEINYKLRRINEKQKEVIDNIKKCFDDGHFEDYCDCLIIEKYINNYLKEVSE